MLTLVFDVAKRFCQKVQADEPSRFLVMLAAIGISLLLAWLLNVIYKPVSQWLRRITPGRASH